MDPELTANLVHTIYAIFAHNYILFAYLIGLGLSIIIAVKKPSRFATFLILGFATLVFSFEYDKHIIEGLRTQTIQSLITTKPHYRLEKWINIMIGEIFPIMFYILGWLLIYLAIIFANAGLKKPSSSQE